LAGPGRCHSPWAAFDRLVMLAAGAESIDAVRCFSSTDA
jgi:elongation factor P--beta-lysine ligase